MGNTATLTEPDDDPDQPQGRKVMMPLLSCRVLVLNATYEAMHICNARRAVILVLSGIAQPVEEGPWVIRSAHMTMRIPEVIRLKRYVRIPFKDITFCRKNILFRDRNTCQYCGHTFPPEQLTVDHIIPLSRGGKDRWDNVVTACRECNSRKGHFLPRELGMALVMRPRKPNAATFLHLMRHHGQSRAVWQKYLYFEHGHVTPEPEYALVN